MSKLFGNTVKPAFWDRLRIGPERRWAYARNESGRVYWKVRRISAYYFANGRGLDESCQIVRYVSTQLLICLDKNLITLIWSRSILEIWGLCIWPSNRNLGYTRCWGNGLFWILQWTPKSIWKSPLKKYNCAASQLICKIRVMQLLSR